MSISLVYFISGLGADRRAFKKLVFPSHFKLLYLDWIPARPNESLEDYASRLASTINTSIPFYLIGLSFGGMLATEIAKRLRPAHTFIISSTPTYTEIPWYYRMAGKLRLQQLVPVSLMKKGNSVGLKFLGAKTENERILLRQLIIDSDPHFMKWALSCILTWKNTERPQNLTHIHGTADRILPFRYTSKPDIIINKGSHFMVYANAREIMKAISEVIKSKEKISGQ